MIIRLISRLFTGIIFIVSGFVKAVDPMGTTYKITDYLSAFRLDIFSTFAFPISVLQASLEFAIGMSILFHARKQLAIWGAFIFMLFFTPLTLFLAITNPVSDCGCFGDAIILSNWETFIKNLLLLLFTVVLFKNRNLETKTYSVLKQHVLLVFFIIFPLCLSIYSYKHLPIIDFRPYHIGANMIDGMTIPEGAHPDEYKSILRYEKDGIVKEFDETNYPWQDSTWTFVDSKSIQIKEGYTPPIHDFEISNQHEGNVTDMILNNSNYTFILVSQSIHKIKTQTLLKIQKLHEFAKENHYSFIALTASENSECEEFKKQHQVDFEFYNVDEVQIKTMIRSNPGLLLMRNGTILHKWHFNDFPLAQNLQGNLTAYALTKHQTRNNNLLLVCISTVLLLFTGFVLRNTRK